MLVVMIVAGLILMLQVFLSNKESKWSGLILPTLCLVCSILSIVGVINYEGTKGRGQITVNISEVEEIVEERIDHIDSNHSNSQTSMILESLTIFVVSNIPTVFLLVIYMSCRNKLRKKLELEKMAIQDLE